MSETADPLSLLMEGECLKLINSQHRLQNNKVTRQDNLMTEYLN